MFVLAFARAQTKGRSSSRSRRGPTVVSTDYLVRFVRRALDETKFVLDDVHESSLWPVTATTRQLSVDLT